MKKQWKQLKLNTKQKNNMFEYENEDWTVEELQKAAKDQGVEFDSYLKQMKSFGMVEKQIDPSVESQASGSENMGLELVDGSSGLQEIKHITQDEFLEISSGEFGYFGDGREEIMSAKLYDTYNPDRAEDGVQFTEFGGGNNVRVTLPNGDEEEFNLSGTGNFTAIETSQVKADHIRLTEFIGQKKNKEINPEKRAEFKSVLENREESLAFDDLDTSIADDLTLLDLKDDNGDSYKFESVNLFENAVEVTLPNGSKKIFNVSGLRTDMERGSESIDKNKIISSMLRYIESNPENYTQTEEYNSELKKVEDKIAPIFDEKNITKLFGSDLNALSGTARATLTDKIKTDLGVQDYIFSGDRTGENKKIFGDLTREQQGDVIDNKINEYVASVTEKYRSAYRAKENKDLLEAGLTPQDINDRYFAKDGSVHSRYDNDYDRGVYLNLQTLDNPDATEDQKTKAKANIESLKTLKSQKGLGKKSSFLNVETMEYEYNTVENTEAGVYNITSEDVELENGVIVKSTDNVEKGIEDEIKDKSLTRAELKEKALSVNLAVDEWNDKWTKGKQKFYLNEMHGDDFIEQGRRRVARQTPFDASRPTPTSRPTDYFKGEEGWIPDFLQPGVSRPDVKIDLDVGGYVYGGVEDAGEGQTRSFVWATDSWAAKNNHMLIDVSMPTEMSHAYNGHLSRMQLGVDLKQSQAAYDKIYGLNETTASVEQGGFGSTFVKGLKESVSGKHTILKSKIDEVDTDQEFRSAMLNIMTDELGYVPTAEEKLDTKATYGETIGSATSGLPRMLVDFTAGNKVLGAIGLNRMVGSLVGNLKKGRYAIQTTKGTEKFNRNQLINHISKTSAKTGKPIKKNPFKVKGANEDKVIDTWMANYVAKNGVKMESIAIPASFTNRAMAINVNSLFEGVKMEVAMQMPRFHGMGYDPETMPEVGGSFATGYGFGLMGGIIPWDKMYKGVMGVKAGITTPGKPGLLAKEAANKGIRVPFTKKEIAFKGIHDYFVAAPLNFYAGSQFGGFTNQLADAMMGQKEWGEWLDENYGDWDHVKKHAVSELISGIALKGHKFNRFDFASEGRLMDLRQASTLKLRNDLYER